MHGLVCPGARCAHGHRYVLKWCSLRTIHDKHRSPITKHCLCSDQEAALSFTRIIPNVQVPRRGQQGFLQSGRESNPCTRTRAVCRVFRTMSSHFCSRGSASKVPTFGHCPSSFAHNPYGPSHRGQGEAYNLKERS